MNKMTAKLFRYFTALLAFFAVTAFTGFLGVFRYFTYQHLENELKARAGVIAGQLEQFLDASAAARGQGRGAYLRFVDDIAMADVYIMDGKGKPFTYGRHGSRENMPGQEVPEQEVPGQEVSEQEVPGREVSGQEVPEQKVLEFAARVFSSGRYEHDRQKSEDGTRIFYAGMPVYQSGQVLAAVVIRNTAGMHQESYVLAVTILAACLVLALLLSGMLSLFLSRRFIYPIHQIAHTIRELAGGNYQVQAEVHDRTELGRLAMETGLLAEKLEAARQESSRMEQMQKNYISNISHELRTPVTVIRSSLEAVCDGVVTGSKAREYERQMLKECISLQRLVNDMLELSRLQNNDFPIEKESMNLFLALDDAVRAVRVLAKEKSICIRYEKELDIHWIEGDYGRLRQMFLITLDNAIQYSPQGSMVCVSAAKKHGQLSVTIQDSGCGIPPQDLEHIFERFYRSANSRAKGSGLGLAILKSIADRHGITVSVESTLQKGTTLVFHIPEEKRSQAE